MGDPVPKGKEDQVVKSNQDQIRRSHLLRDMNPFAHLHLMSSSQSSSTTSKVAHGVRSDTTKAKKDGEHKSGHSSLSSAKKAPVDNNQNMTSPLNSVLSNIKSQVVAAGLSLKIRPPPLTMSVLDSPPLASQTRKPVFAQHHNIYHHDAGAKGRATHSTSSQGGHNSHSSSSINHQIPHGAGDNIKVVNALYRRIVDLEAENQRLREGMTSSDQVKGQKESQQQQQQHAEIGDRHVTMQHGRATPPIPPLAPALTVSMSASPTADASRKSRAKGSKSHKYPMGISRYSWPPGSPNSKMARSIAEALEELNSENAAGANNDFRSESPCVLNKAPPKNFTEFAIVGVRASVLKGEEEPRRNEQPLQVLARVTADDEFDVDIPTIRTSSSSMASGRSSVSSPPPPPSLSLAHMPSTIEKLAEFCFPRGCRLELAHSSELELCTGRHRDQTHVLQFTDSYGSTTYGVCITVYEAIADCPPSLVEDLKQIRREHEAARKIQQFLRRRSDTVVEEDVPGEIMEADEGDVGWVRKGIFDQVRNRMKKLQLASSGWGTPTRKDRVRISRAGEPRASRCYESDENDEYQKSVRAADGEAARPRSGQRSSQVKDENDLLVIAPRCFCLMSQQANHPVLCKLLQLMVERERVQAGKRRRDAKSASAIKRRHSCNTLLASPPLCPVTGQPVHTLNSPRTSHGSSPPIASTILDKYRSENAVSSPAERNDLASVRKRFLRYIQTEVFPTSNSLTISFPAYTATKTRLDFPVVPLQHWTVAVLFSRVSVDVIIKCVNILLLEQSLVIVGEDLGLVSSIGTALTSLLAPFKWDGVFIPVLPDGLNDILQSPVPFVLGVSPPFDPSRVPNASVLYIGRTKEYLRVPQMETKLPLCYQHLQELHDAGKIFLGRRSKWANLHLSTYMSGLTPDETKAITSLRNTCQGYVEGLCGDLKYGDAWRKYGAFNATTHDFEFFPGWFLAPLQMMLDFQSTIVHTQMFHSYIDKRRAEDLKALQHKVRCQTFIALFCAFKFRRLRCKRAQQLKKEAILPSSERHHQFYYECRSTKTTRRVMMEEEEEEIML